MKDKYNLSEADAERLSNIYQYLKKIPAADRKGILRNSLSGLAKGAKRGLTKKGTAIAGAAGAAGGVGLSYLKNRKQLSALKAKAEAETNSVKKAELESQIRAIRNKLVVSGLAGGALGAGANIARHAARGYAGEVEGGIKTRNAAITTKAVQDIKARADQETSQVMAQMEASNKARAEAAEKERINRINQGIKNRAEAKKIAAEQDKAQAEAKKQAYLKTPKGRALDNIRGAISATKTAGARVAKEPVVAAGKKVEDIKKAGKESKDSFWTSVGDKAAGVRDYMSGVTPAPTAQELQDARTERFNKLTQKPSGTYQPPK